MRLNKDSFNFEEIKDGSYRLRINKPKGDDTFSVEYACEDSDLEKPLSFKAKGATIEECMNQILDELDDAIKELDEPEPKTSDIDDLITYIDDLEEYIVDLEEYIQELEVANENLAIENNELQTYIEDAALEMGKEEEEDKDIYKVREVRLPIHWCNSLVELLDEMLEF